MTAQTSIDYLTRLQETLIAYPHEAFERLAAFLTEARDEHRRVYVMGNGGSASTASHWVCDMNKGCSADESRPRFRMFALNDSVPTVLAYANDRSYDVVFEEQLKNHLEPNDLVIAISGSGNSANVLRAVEYAHGVGARTAALTGFSGGRLASLVDVALVIRSDDMQIIEDGHVITMHMLMQRFARC